MESLDSALMLAILNRWLQNIQFSNMICIQSDCSILGLSVQGLVSHIIKTCTFGCGFNFTSYLARPLLDESLPTT